MPSSDLLALFFNLKHELFFLSYKRFVTWHGQLSLIGIYVLFIRPLLNARVHFINIPVFIGVLGF